MSRPRKDAGLGRSRGRRIFDPFRAESDSAFDPRKRRPTCTRSNLEQKLSSKEVDAKGLADLALAEVV